MNLVTKRNSLLFNEIGIKLNNNKELQHFIVTCIKHFIVCRKHTNFGHNFETLILVLTKQYAPCSQLGVLGRNKVRSRGILKDGCLVIGALKCWERRKREAIALRCFTKQLLAKVWKITWKAFVSKIGFNCSPVVCSFTEKWISSLIFSWKFLKSYL